MSGDRLDIRPIQNKLRRHLMQRRFLIRRRQQKPVQPRAPQRLPLSLVLQNPTIPGYKNPDPVVGTEMRNPLQIRGMPAVLKPRNILTHRSVIKTTFC